MATSESLIALINDPAGVAIVSFAHELTPGVQVELECSKGGPVDENTALRYVHRTVEPSKRNEQTIKTEVARVRGVLDNKGAVVKVYGRSDLVTVFVERFRELRALQLGCVALAQQFDPQQT